MNISRSALAATAAVGLLVSQSAAAAAPVVRAEAPMAQSEKLGGSAGLMPFLAVFAVFAVVGLVVLFDDDDDGSFPVSP